MPRINGISKATLWESWRNVRKQLSRTFLRDVTDFVEYDVDPDWWIKRLLDDLATGKYEPATPTRFPVAKKMGFSRRMTQPSIPDLVIYRAIVDQIYKKAKRHERKHVYFAQNTLAKKVRTLEAELEDGDSAYKFLSGNAILKWLEYDQYRKHLLLDHVHPFIVTTDITNFFDTVLFDRVADALHNIRVDRELVGLLFFILERLSIRDAFNESPRIGLPVDDFDCSRTLAHLVLFPHDDRMTKVVGEGAYIRWMDDQNFGVASYAEGLNVLRQCGDSLARLHLTPNAGKSRILSLEQAQEHFHFDINAELDVITALPKSTPAERRVFAARLYLVWRRNRQHEQRGGEWNKILKRFYRLAGLSGARFLRSRTRHDALREPTLIDRVADYVRVTGSASEYLAFMNSLWNHPEQVYPDVNQVLVERLLMLEPNPAEAKSIRQLASGLLAGKSKAPGKDRCAAIAPLLILRYGDRRSLKSLKKVVSDLESAEHPAIAKAAVAVYCSYGRTYYQEACDAASRLRDNHLAHFLKMLSVSQQYSTVPNRFKFRRDPLPDVVGGKKFFDMRRLLTLRLLALNDKRTVKKWLRDAKEKMLKMDVSDYDKILTGRLLP